METKEEKEKQQKIQNKLLTIFGIVIIIIVVLYFVFPFIFPIILRWGFVIISCAGGFFICKYFFQCFIKKKFLQYTMALLIVLLGFGMYKLNHKPKNYVRMKENIMYIAPKSAIDTTNTDTRSNQMKEDVLYIHPKIDTINDK